MGVLSAYNNLALQWSPDTRIDHRFNLIVIIVLIIALLLSVVLSSIKLPPEKRRAHTPVPERIAKFILEKEKPKVVKPKPKPKPLPKLKLKPKIKKKPPRNDVKKKPLTKALKKARKKAESSGLLALSNELADLMDTSEVSAMVSGRTLKGSTKAATLDKNLLTKGTGIASGGVNSDKYAMAVGNTQLSSKELKIFRKSLLAKNASEPKRRSATKANRRLEEQVTIVFDRNKSKLYLLYNRARRKNPSLKGKIILEITIAPSGKVTNVKILVTELNNPSLEQRIVSRVRQFNFGQSGNETITVTFPIEFIPS